ncbi:MAG: pantoate--beta-alanine ligase [Flavobacteriales bacterium]|nr:pantoate--beta-alanine ligase [Flavobacteriales bacterium]
MLSVHKPEILAEILQNAIGQGKSIGFVPTMGAIHRGHVSLVERARSENDFTVCSIFVNPRQFNEQKDLDLYPRPIESDMALLLDAGVDVLFLPDSEEMYPPDYSAPYIELGQLELLLEGAMRPGHFRGVAQVVDRLFSIVQPSRAYFGQKDFQQTVVIQKLIDQRYPNIRMVVCPIVREANGLAFSSRNERLTVGEREQASFIYEALKTLKEACATEPLETAINKARFMLELVEDATVEYLEAVNAHDMSPVDDLNAASTIVAVTVVRYGGVRLLDNIILKQS